VNYYFLLRRLCVWGGPTNPKYVTYISLTEANVLE